MVKNGQKVGLISANVSKTLAGFSGRIFKEVSRAARLVLIQAVFKNPILLTLC